MSVGDYNIVIDPAMGEDQWALVSRDPNGEVVFNIASQSPVDGAQYTVTYSYSGDGRETINSIPRDSTTREPRLDEVWAD